MECEKAVFLKSVMLLHELIIGRRDVDYVVLHRHIGDRCRITLNSMRIKVYNLVFVVIRLPTRYWERRQD